MNEEIELVGGPLCGKVVEDIGYPGFIPMPTWLADGTSAIAFYEIELGEGKAVYSSTKVKEVIS